MESGHVETDKTEKLTLVVGLDEKHNALLEKCKKIRDKNMKNFDYSFIDSVTAKLKEGEVVTDAQYIAVENIYKKYRVS
jgi:hypothetical protein